MATRNTDVNLIIRAKTEGEKAISSLADAIDHLVNGAGSGSKDLLEFGRTIAALDKAAGGLAAAQDRVGTSASKQAAAVHQATAGIAEQQARIDTLKRGLEILGAEADKAFVGPRRNGLGDLIRTAKGELRDAERQLGGYTTAYERNLTALRASRSGLLDLRRASAETADAQAEAAAAADLTTQAIERQAEATRNAAAAQRFYNNKGGPRIGSASANGATRDLGGASAFVTEIEQMEREAAQLRAALDPVAAIQDRYNAQLTRYRQLAAAGKITTDQLTAAQHRLAEEAEQARLSLDRLGNSAGGGAGKIGLFGLRPYELQNLSYQINDVVTGLASGQNATQIIAQQGGQILQLFPRMAGSLIGALKDPRILLLVATVVTLAKAFQEAADQAERLRTFSSEVSFRADGDSYDPQKLAGAAKALELMGNKGEEAEAAVRAFLNEGLNPELLDQFSRAAHQTAQRLGIDLPDAAKQVAAAFSGGYDAVAEFDNKLNFLTASERERIRTLFEQGEAEAARSAALAAYSRQSEEAAAKQRGPWGDAAKSLGKAWNALIDWIANSAPIKITIAVMNELAGAVKAVGDAITDVLTDDAAPASGAAGVTSRIATVQQQIRDLKEKIGGYEASIKNGSPVAGTLQRLVDIMKKELADAQAELARLEKSAPDTVSDDPDSVAAKQRADELSRISREDELQRLRDAGQSRMLTAAEKARRAELAGQVAARNASDAQVAAALKRQAVAKETAAIDRESEARAKAAKAEREREIRQFNSRVIGAEGGSAKNPYSNAQGYGQFIPSTWLDQFAKVFAEQSRNLSREQILALRQNEAVAKAIIDNYARENARFLESFGARVTAGNLYLTHFLGPGTAKAVLTARGNTPVDQIIRRVDRNAESVLSGNRGYLRTNGGKGRYRTADELEAFIANRVGDTGQPQTQGQVAIGELIADAKRKQDEFNASVRHGVEDKEDALRAQREENQLYGTALLAAQRRNAITAAERELRQKVEDANKNLEPGETPVVVSQEQIDKAKELAAALFDAQNAKQALNARLDDAQRPLDALIAQRDLMREQAEYLRSIGETDAADAIESQFVDLAAKIREAYQALIDFYAALTPEQRVQLGIVDQAQLDNIIAKLKQGQQQTQEWGKVAGISARDIAQSFASNASQAFTNFINKVAAGKNVFKALGEGIREFAANFILSIAQMILQLLAYAAAVQILRALGVPIPTTTVGVSHTGGIAGQGTGQHRSVAPMLFAGAMRYHTGGIVGLAPDEVPIIARKGEEVLTESNPRHRNNAGAEGGAEAAMGSVAVIQVPDHAAALETALRQPKGVRVFFDFVRENKGAFQAAIG